MAICMTTKAAENIGVALHGQRKKSKYNNVKTVIDGVTFDSKAEAKYYGELKIRQKAGEIAYFTLQPKFLLQEAFIYKGKAERAIYYIADFKVVYPDKRIEIVDVKGKKTKEYLIKRKMFLKRYPEVAFREVFK